MIQHTHRSVNGVQVDLTPEEIAEIKAEAAVSVPPSAPITPTKEELLVKLQELQTQIQALE